MADNTERSAEMLPRTEDITITVTDGYTIDSVMPMSTGTVPVTFGDPSPTGGTTVTIPVTIPSADAGAPVGPVSAEVTSMVTETETMRTREETSTPLNTMTFIPFYQGVFTARNSAPSLGILRGSAVGLENGTMVTFTHTGADRERQYAYLALEMVENRTYRFDAGFFDIAADALPNRETMFGRTFEFFEFPTRADLSFTIRW